MFPLRTRPSQPADAPSIEAVHRAAFPSGLEARLVALLFERGQAAISLVAEVDGRVVGHVLFSPAKAGSAGPAEPDLPVEVESAIKGSARQAAPTGVGLAPLAVLPQFQCRGIGSALVRAGLVECRRSGAGWVIVLGDPAYYSRFGFLPASRWQLNCEFGGGDAFQFLPLTGDAAAIQGGLAHYASAFGELMSGGA